MSFEKLHLSIQEFNQSNPSDSKNIIENNKEYRGNQHDLDTFNNTIQYIEYKKNLKKNKKTIKQKTVETYNDVESIQKSINELQYKKKWSRLDTYCKKEKISEYIEKEVGNGTIGKASMKECIAHLFRLLEQKKLNKKGNIEYDSDIGEITSISKNVLDTDFF